MAQGLIKKPKSGNNTSAKPKRYVCVFKLHLISSPPTLTSFPGNQFQSFTREEKANTDDAMIQTLRPRPQTRPPPNRPEKELPR